MTPAERIATAVHEPIHSLLGDENADLDIECHCEAVPDAEDQLVATFAIAALTTDEAMGELSRRLRIDLANGPEFGRLTPPDVVTLMSAAVAKWLRGE